jgi:predicted metalloprotease with PDZ domain
MTIRYTLTGDRALDHRVPVTGEIDGLTGETVDLVLPVWVPGSYIVLDYSRFLDGLTARVPTDGRPVPVQRVDKTRWRIGTGGSTSVEVQFSVYGYQMVNEGIDVTSEHFFVNAALGLPYVDGRKDEPYEVAIRVPSDWKIYTELPEVGTSPPRFRARDYDELIDSPVDCGHPVDLGFIAAGVPHRILLCGRGGNYEAHRLEEDLRKITEAQIRLFGESPVRHYTFFVHLNDITDGALEHLNSNSAVYPRNGFRPHSDYLKFLATASHEYFHLYNVKRIHPSVLGPFDYTREVYTKLIWAMEGTTDYYGYLMLRRGGVTSPAKYLETLAGQVHTYLGVPGRLVRSLEESSFLTWIDLYKAMEETRNRSVSYYLKGLLVSFCLDLEIRSRTENKTSLDTVMQALWTRFGRPGKGFGEEEFLPFVSEAAGVDLAPFFAKYVSGVEEIDFDRFARSAGLTFGPKPSKSEPDDDGDAGWLGVDFENRDGRVRITTVFDGGPGRRAGLSPGDEIIAVDHAKVAFDRFPLALQRAPPGSTIDLAVFRRGWLTHVAVTTGAPPPEKHQFRAAEDASPLQKAVYESWLGAKWTPPEKPPADGASPPA